LLALQIDLRLDLFGEYLAIIIVRYYHCYRSATLPGEELQAAPSSWDRSGERASNEYTQMRCDGTDGPLQLGFCVNAASCLFFYLVLYYENQLRWNLLRRRIGTVLIYCFGDYQKL
jgi:hypothetical protein